MELTVLDLSPSFSSSVALRLGFFICENGQIPCHLSPVQPGEVNVSAQIMDSADAAPLCWQQALPLQKNLRQSSWKTVKGTMWSRGRGVECYFRRQCVHVPDLADPWGWVSFPESPVGSGWHTGSCVPPAPRYRGRHHQSNPDAISVLSPAQGATDSQRLWEDKSRALESSQCDLQPGS